MQRLLGAIVLMGIVAGCRATPSVDQRVCSHFQITETKDVTPERVRETLLARLPPGTPEPQIYDYLKQSGIGQDQWSTYYPVDDDRRIFCHVDADPATYSPFGSKRKGYAIYFLLDYRSQLHDIRVESWPPEEMARPMQISGVNSTPAGTGGGMRR